MALFELIVLNPSIAQVQLSEKIGVTDRTIKQKMKSLQEKGFIQRANGERNGHGEILIEF